MIFAGKMKDMYLGFCIFVGNLLEYKMKLLYTIGLLIVSNVFMTFAWYGHLKLQDMKVITSHTPLLVVILMSWSLAFAEYCCQVPANRIGFAGNGGPLSLIQLKVIQEVITLLVFMGFSILFFRTESIGWNHCVSFVLLVLAVFFAFYR